MNAVPRITAKTPLFLLPARTAPPCKRVPTSWDAYGPLASDSELFLLCPVHPVLASVGEQGCSRSPNAPFAIYNHLQMVDASAMQQLLMTLEAQRATIQQRMQTHNDVLNITLEDETVEDDPNDAAAANAALDDDMPEAAPHPPPEPQQGCFDIMVVDDESAPVHCSTPVPFAPSVATVSVLEPHAPPPLPAPNAFDTVCDPEQQQHDQAAGFFILPQ